MVQIRDRFKKIIPEQKRTSIASEIKRREFEKESRRLELNARNEAGKAKLQRIKREARAEARKKFEDSRKGRIDKLFTGLENIASRIPEEKPMMPVKKKKRNQFDSFDIFGR